MSQCVVNLFKTVQIQQHYGAFFPFVQFIRKLVYKLPSVGRLVSESRNAILNDAVILSILIIRPAPIELI
jgi:hypothetical protein